MKEYLASKDHIILQLAAYQGGLNLNPKKYIKCAKWGIPGWIPWVPNFNPLKLYFETLNLKILDLPNPDFQKIQKLY